MKQEDGKEDIKEEVKEGRDGVREILREREGRVTIGTLIKGGGEGRNKGERRNYGRELHYLVSI